MFITNKDLVFLNKLNDYLKTLDNESAVGSAFSNNLNLLIERLEIKRVVKNSINSKLIAERRKTDKYYARSKKGSEE